MWSWLVFVTALAVLSAPARSAGAGAARLVCYAAKGANYQECSHLVYTGDARGEKLDAQLKEWRKNNPRIKIVLRVSEADKDLRSLLKSKYIQGLEIYDAHKALNRTKVTEAVEAARAAVSSSGGGPVFLALPAHPELLAKYYDLRTLVKKVDLMMVQTHALGAVKKMTYHPSRLSGIWDMMNTDSVVDLAVGLGVPASKIVISLPASVRQFTLVNETLSTPGSPAVDDEPKEVDQAELCRQLQKGRWTLERDQDLSAPYAFKDKTWMSFEDSSSVDVKGKYARVRGLAGLALHGAERDVETPCGPSLKTSLAKVLNQQSRAPRAAVLRSLEHEILSAPAHARALDALQVSPYRITQVVDSDGVIHSIREDTRTEFSCSRQGYFVHPRSCARFYRCVKFDQLSPEFTVFEFDCPAGLAFDARYEVCVWPGSLPHSQACPGSSEIAPVPQTRFICPEHEGYYADPENCRWFFACLDHGKAPLTAYEFRCPFGLGFDAEKLKCDWPWVVPACGNIARYEAEAFGFSGAALTGATGFEGQTADAVNVAAHNSLVSGASFDNLVGIQSGFLSKDDALDPNFIASQDFVNGQEFNHGVQGSSDLAFQLGQATSLNGNLGLVQATQYSDVPKYTSGSLILDEYRLPTKHHHIIGGVASQIGENAFTSSSIYSGSTRHNADNSGAYVHDPTGDHAVPYKHIGSPVVPYIHDASKYNDNFDIGRYSDSQSVNNGHYRPDNSGAYFGTGAGGYTGSYNDYSGSYTQDDSGKYVAGVYRADGHIGNEGKTTSGSYYHQNNGVYSSGNTGYVTDSQAYTGASHTLTAGAVNVGLVGKTTLVDAGYSNQGGYTGTTQSFSHGHEISHNGHVPIISQPAVSIKHVGTDDNNFDGYIYHTTPTSSVVPTTATPLAPTAAVYSTYVPEAPKTSIKEIFGITQPRLTNIQHVLVSVKQPSVQITDYNVGLGSFGQNSQSSGYDYPKPSINFEDGATYTTQAPIVVSTFKPDGFSHNHQLQSGYQYSTPVPVAEEPFKKVVAYTTGPSIASVAPTVSTYQPHSFSHETIHKVGNTYSSSSGDGYGSTVSFEQPKTVVQYTTPQPSFVQSQGIVHNVDVSQVKLSGDSGSGYAYEKPALGYVYSKPAIKFEEVPQSVVYSTPAPVVSTYQPHSYSHETFHNVQTKDYLPPVTYPQQTVTVYENPLLKISEKVTPVTYVQPTVQTYSQSTAQSHGFSHETLHKVDANKANTYSENIGSGYQYEQPTIKFEETPKTVVEYTTATPVVSTYAPHSFSHQTLHKVEASKVHTYSDNDAGYQYEKPVIKFEETPNIVEYSTPAAPTESAYSHQTLHHFDSKVNAYPVVSNVGYKLEKVPQVVQYSTPAPIVSYNPQLYSHETVHKLENKVNTYSQGSGYTYEQPAVKIEEIPQIVQYTTPAPVVSTYQPHSYSHQTLHKVEASKVNAYSQDTESGYKYEQPSIKFEEAPKILQYTTPAPTVSTYNPQSYNHETIHNIQSIFSTPKTIIEYKQPAVTVYENPILKFTQTVTPTPAIYTQQHKVSHVITQPIQQLSYQQTLGQEYSYNQPEIQRDAETLNAGKTYSDATLVSQQYYHQSNVNHGIQDSGKKAVFVSSTPATLAYEEHYSEYESPKIKTYNAPEYVPPKSQYQQTVSTFAPVTQQEYNYKTDFRSQQYDSVPIQQVSFSTSHIEQPTKVESVHFSSLPEIQSEYTAEEYLPPVVSTVAPVASSTYRPVIYSTASTKEYLPPTSKPEYNAPEYLAPVPEYQSKEYLPPKVTYLPPSSTAKPTTQAPIYLPPSTKAPEYLPPKQEQNILNFESFGFKNADDNIQINPYKEYIVSSTAVPDRQHNIVVETSKSNLLGFGTVGPDAGLVSPVSYTTSAPVISSTYTPYYEISSQAPIRKIKPIYKSTTQSPYVESTSYRAPEYLPPLNEYDTNYNFDSFGLKTGDINYRDEVVVSTSAPLQRKQNIVVQTAKSRLHSNDAGLTYTTSAPIVSTEGYLPPRIVSSTYAPIKQELVEVTRVPARRTKPKVAVVTKVNDFNPLLVRKLGAVCSCQSPVLVLKGSRPNVQQDFDDYGNDYEEEGRGDISDVDEGQWAQKTARIQPSAKSAYVTSTFNPIIVPDDSFYQDLPNDENESSLDITPKVQQVYSEQYASSTPTAVVTQRTVRIKPRVKSVTVAPTYQTVLLKQDTAPDAVAKAAEGSLIQSQSFDRYGPGGWRSREETLQGSVDCQRAGLFRHPKQCNKFYACRWDCTKQRFTLHVFNCPVQLSFDPSIGACNWPSQGPACQGDTLLTNAV